MAKFRVALSGDFLNADGSAAFPMFDLAPLKSHPTMEMEFVRPVEGVMPASSLADFDALILLAPRYSRGSIHANGRLGLVARFGAGFDAVDLDACTNGGIAVVNTPAGVRRPVAVSILTLLLALTGNLFVKDKITRQGPSGFHQRSRYMGQGLVGKVLGSVGLGNIGTEMFKLARPFDMHFIAHAPRATSAQASALGVTLVDLETLFKQSDILTLNCPLNESTRHLVNEARLRLMKPTAYLINTARGGVVDQKALTRALKEKWIAGAGLDVFEHEPPDASDPLFDLDNVIVTPHSLCWTDQMFEVIGKLDIEAVSQFRAGSVPENVVNPSVLQNSLWRTRLDNNRRMAAEA